MKTIETKEDLQSIVLKLEKFNLTDLESEKIIGYFEGHDYMIKTNEKDLFVVDVIDEEDINKEKFKNIVCRVIDWNDELITSTRNEIYSSCIKLTNDKKSNELTKKFNESMNYLFELNEDEKILNVLYTILTRKGMREDVEKEIIKEVKKLLNINDITEELDIVKVEVIGSRKIGRHRKDSDLDILIEYDNDIKEYVVFNMLNTLSLQYEEIYLDFFPVCKYKYE